MATTRVNHQQATVAGGTLVWTAGDVANGGNFLPNAGRVVLLQNTSGAPVTATFVTPQTSSGVLAIADLAVVVAANSIAVLSIQDPTDFITPAGQVDFTLSAALNVAVVQA